MSGGGTDARPAPRRHVILVGLPGAGKSTVGPLVARMLGVACHDVDAVIVARTGRAPSAIFAEDGEPAFRALEREVMGDLLAGAPAVLVPGAGWAAQEGALDAVGARGVVVHLDVPAAVAAARLADDTSRPLLAGGDLGARLAALDAARRPSYQRAAVTVSAAGSAAAVAAAVAASLTER